jgi:hypothetical protein
MSVASGEGQWRVSSFLILTTIKVIALVEKDLHYIIPSVFRRT